MLKTKSIKAPAEESDGIRISIMSRHTLNDGVTPDPGITADSFDVHWLRLSPPPRLIGEYYRDRLSWDGFEKNFMKYLEAPIVKQTLTHLGNMAIEGNVTIMCREETPEQCHRRLVAEKCQEMFEGLVVELN